MNNMFSIKINVILRLRGNERMNVKFFGYSQFSRLRKIRHWTNDEIAYASLVIRTDGWKDS